MAEEPEVSNHRKVTEVVEVVYVQEEEQSAVKKESDWVTQSSQNVEVVNTSDYKSEVVFTNEVQCLREPSI